MPRGTTALSTSASAGSLEYARVHSPPDVLIDMPSPAYDAHHNDDPRSSRSSTSTHEDSAGEALLTCDSSANPRADALLVLRFDRCGRHSYAEMNRNDILHVIRAAEANPREITARDASPRRKEEQRSGHARSISPMGAYCDLQPVHMRDLRQLDESFAEPNETAVILRKQAILVNADPIRAVILRDGAMVLIPDGADRLLLLLINAFRCCMQVKDSRAPYEFKALEAVLDTLSRMLEEEYARHERQIMSTLDRLVQVRIMAGELETMRVMKNNMNTFEAQVDSLRRALVALLDNEEDLRLLYLSKLFEDPALLFDLGAFDPEQVEILLEAYLKDTNSTRTKAHLLQHRVQTTESLIAMKLDYARNYLLALQLLLSLVGLALGVGTLISGIFGMNFKAGFLDAETAFWAVLASIFVSIVSAIWGGVVWFRRQGLMIAT